MRKGGKSEEENTMISEKRTQAKHLRKARKKQYLMTCLMTSLLVGGTLLPMTMVLADNTGSEATVSTSESLASADETDETGSSLIEDKSTAKDISNEVEVTTTSDEASVSDIITDNTEETTVPEESLSENNQTTNTTSSTQDIVQNEPDSITDFEQDVPVSSVQETNQRTYHLGSDGFWYADDLDDRPGYNYFVDLDFTFMDRETGAILATVHEDKYYFDIETGLVMDLTFFDIDTSIYGIKLASQEYIQHVNNPLSKDGFYSGFSVLDRSELYNDGAGTMRLVITLDRLSDTTSSLDEENRPILEQTIANAKPYIDRDKYQATYVDVLEQAVLAGEQALTDNPQVVQTRSFLRSTGATGTVFQAHIEAINKALADVKANPIVPKGNTDDLDNTTDTNNSSNNTVVTNTPSTNVDNSNKKPTTTESSSDKNDKLPQTGESENPLLPLAGLTTLASTALLWFLKQKRA